VFPRFSVGLGAPGIDRVSFFVTHGLPAFSDRLVGADFLVNPCVSFQHAAKIAKIQRTLPCNLRKTGGEGRIIENSGEFSRKRRGIASRKREAAFAEHFDERAEIGRDHRQTSRHIFGNYQAENFSTKGWDDYDRGLRERGIEFCSQKTSRKPNMARKRCVLRMALEGGALRAVANDEEFERAILRKQSARSFEKNPGPFRGDQPALKGDNRGT